MRESSDDGTAVPARRKGKWLIGCVAGIFVICIAAGAVALLGARWAAEDYRNATAAGRNAT